MSGVTKALIPAAGRGTRFLPLTKSVPKERAPLVSTPALEFVVAEAAERGITDVLIVTSAGKAAITECFHAICFAPKPPPMCGVRTRTRSFGSPSFPATSSRTAKMPCVDSYSVSSSPSQTAVQPCGSRALWSAVPVV